MKPNQIDAVFFEKKVKADCTIQSIMAAQFPVQFRRIKGQMIRIRSFVDYVVAIDGKAVFLDAKVTRERHWNLKEHVLAEKKVHQFHHLVRARSFGSLGGYLIWFQAYHQFAWVPVEAIQRAIEKDVASITPASKFVITQNDDSQIFFRELFFRQGSFLDKTREQYHVGEAGKE